MTKKDYELMAEAFWAAKEYMAGSTMNDGAFEICLNAWADCVRQFCIVAIQDNRRFDAARFCTACRVPQELAESTIAYCSSIRERDSRHAMRKARAR